MLIADNLENINQPNKKVKILHNSFFFKLLNLDPQAHSLNDKKLELEQRGKYKNARGRYKLNF